VSGNKYTVDILLSVYNGERYLREQLDSIINQTYNDWNLIIRDDGSVDNTVGIIEEYLKKYPEKITLRKDNKGNLGYKNSFAELMRRSAANYISFADQDDYWMPEKIERMIEEMKKREESKSVPTLISCDLQICDDQLQLMDASYHKHVGIHKNTGSHAILLASHLHGCVFLFNKALLDVCNRIIDPEKGLSEFTVNGHDNFLSVVCALAGQIYFMDEALVKHRIHGSNSIGYSRTESKSFSVQLKSMLRFLFDNKGYRERVFRQKINENLQIIEAYRKKISADIPEPFRLFLRIGQLNWIQRKYCNVKYPFIISSSASDRLVYILCF
jgi:glycosyltransferase involved in cell wall biosynthesis